MSRMYRGHHPRNPPVHQAQFDQYRRGGGGGGYHHNNEDPTLELIQTFRNFKPYLRKRLQEIDKTGRNSELQDEVEDIRFYLAVMDDILADETHGVDQLKGYIDKIHEMIRKNPTIEASNNRRRSVDYPDEEFGDEDRPRSPSPEARGSERDANIPLIPTHGAHRTVEVNFTPSSRGEPASGNDKWGRRDPYARREPSFKDVDMRSGFYHAGNGPGPSGRGERRWSGESDFSGAQGMGRGGMGGGRGVPPSLPRRNDDYRADFSRPGRGRGVIDNDLERQRQEIYRMERIPRSQEINHNNRERDFKPPDWMNDDSPNANGNMGSEWLGNDTTDSGFQGDYERRQGDRGGEWRRNQTELDSKERAAQHIAKHFERRPSSETRRDNDDYISIFERRERERALEARPDVGFGRGRRDDDRHVRSRMDGVSSPTYPPPPPHSNNPINQMSYQRPPPPPHGMHYNVPPPRQNIYPPNTGPGLLPTPSFGGRNSPHLPNIQPPMVGVGGVRPMNYSHPPPSLGTFSRPGMMPTSSNYRIPPPQMPSMRLPPPSPSPHHSSEPPPPQLHHHSGFPGYSSPPAEPSPEELRDITMAKAKNCFNRNPNRISAPSTVTSVPVGPASPNVNLSDPSGSNPSPAPPDPRISHLSKPGAAQTRQQSPPATSYSKHNNNLARTDAGNVLRTTVDPRVRKVQEDRRRSIEKERARHPEPAKPHNKPSKLQELRKQIEKEGLFRLGRPQKKQSGSFEDAIASCDAATEDLPANKTTDKIKGTSPTRTKEKDGNDGRQQRSHSDKTERGRSPKKRDEKEKGKSKSANSDKKKNNGSNSNNKSNKVKSPKKLDEPSKKSKSSPRKTSKSASPEKDTPDKSITSVQIIDQIKPPTFKIPRKPKPKQPEIETHVQPVSKPSDQSEKDVSATPPDSPEPALSQVPDSDSRNTDETEPSTSTKSTTQSSASPPKQDPMEVLKQFLMTSAEPADREYLLSNPDNLKEIFSKIMTEISAAKGKSNEESNSSRPNSAGSEAEKSQDQERGRSRERKRNTKRRSSLEKLHDALKEMRFDTMLPLGPRRCTRGEVAAETPDTNETTAMETDNVEVVAPSTSAPVETVADAEKPNPKKRGRPRKVNQKAGEETTELEKDEVISEPAPPTKALPPASKLKGRKRKLKPVKLSTAKRLKNSGPLTRAQAALKKSHKDVAKKTTTTTSLMIDGKLQNKNQDANTKKKKTSKIILRRLGRNKKVKAIDTIVNKGLGKIKLESDSVSPVKREPEKNPLLPADDRDTIFNSFDSSFLPDDLTQMIDDQLNDEAFANLDKQTDDNVDLTVFNSLDAEEPVHQVTVTHEVDLDMEAAGPSSGLSYDDILNESASSVKPGSRRRTSTSASSFPVAKTETNNITVPEVDPLASVPFNMDTEDANQPESNASCETKVLPLPVTSTNSSSPGKQLRSGSIPEKGSINNLTFKNVAIDDESTNSSDNTLADLNFKRSLTPSGFASVADPKKIISDSFFSDSVSSTSSCSDQSQFSLSPLKSAISEDARAKNDASDMSVKAELLDPDKFKCEKCSFSGKKIVPHYVNKHYPCNIPQARLQKETFDGLLEMNCSGSPQLLEITLDNTHTLIWPCLYCENRFSCIVDFFDHLTTHTGEFRFECGECSISYPYQKSLVNHVKLHKGVSKNCLRTVYDSGVNKSSKELEGFLCNDCFYFQLRFESIMRHIEETKHNALEVRSVKLIRPSTLGIGTSEPVLLKDTPLGGEFTKAPVLDGKTSLEKLDLMKKEIREEQKQLKSVESNEIVKAVVDDSVIDTNENQEVFFGTDIDFSPPSVTLNECTLKIGNVFENRFLDSLLKKVCDATNSEETNTNEMKEPSKDNTKSESKKRKRRDSCEDDLLDESDGDDDMDSEKASSLDDSEIDKEKAKQNRSAKPRVCLLKKMRLKAREKELELNPEEPNDYFASSEESSEESSESEESDNDSPLNNMKDELVEVKEEIDDGIPQILRNNEFLIKKSTIEKDPYIEKYMGKRNLVYVRRPGDLYDPSTVLFGYNRPSSANTTTMARLRDSRELEKLGGIFGKRIFPMKGSQHFNEMLTTEKLLHLFKCMGTYCSYTTDDYNAFMTHLTCDHVPFSMVVESCARFVNHEDSLTMRDIDCCSYCAARYMSARDLINHIVNQHGQSVFQCNKCFYRSYYQRYVTRHFDLDHPNEEMVILKCTRKIQSHTQEATLFQIFVYKCNIENPLCDKTRRFVFREDFLEHLKECGPDQELYPCHLCTASVELDSLVEHYKEHNLFRFHCSYCPFGSEVKTDLDEHFVSVHPNTSGRVFYRVKPIGQQQSSSTVVSVGVNPHKETTSKGSIVAEHTEGIKSGSSKCENSPCSEREGSTDQDPIDQEDGEKGRITNLKGRELYRCVTGNCTSTATDSESFKDHVASCSSVTESRSLSCAHCERKLKTVTNLLEHMKVHGEKKQVCSLCAFRCWTSTEITKHIKTVHRVMSYKLIKQDATETDVDPDVVVYPKDVFIKSVCDIESFENNYYSFTKKAVYSFENIDKLPLSKVFSADLFCAMCPYSTKVRTNIIRHLSIHKQALEDGKTIVPQAPRINPVPYLSREGLEFDKMMNLAASSHKTDGGTTADEVRKLPQFVKDQFRYVCSVCDHITSDESLLVAHMKAIHWDVTAYQCPHCQKIAESKDNPEYTVPLDKISHHLRLHGPKLYKCGHCMVVHYNLRTMEKHIPEKHPEKKPIHYLIRDVDPDGIPSNRPTTSGKRRESLDDPKVQSTEKWKCFLCSSKSVFVSWEETKNHCEAVHKVCSQFICRVCDFASDDVTEMLTHCKENCKSENKNKILVMFSKCESFDAEDTSVTAPVWKRYGGAVRHIHGNFTEDSVSLIKQYNSQQNNDSVLVTTSPTKGASLLPTNSKNLVKPTTSTTKARRSISGSVLAKPCSNPIKAVLNAPSGPILAQLKEMFKFKCHKCEMYKTSKPNDLRVHLFNEFGYKRWRCLTCDKTFTTEKSLKGHIERDHQKVYQPDLYELKPEVPDIETEIDECIEKQNRKKDLINSFAVEKEGKLACKYCVNEEGLTYDSFETHILLNHSS